MQPLQNQLTIDHSWYIRPDNITEATSAGGVVARIDNNDRVYIAVTKEIDMPMHVLPKGGIEPGELPEITARREVSEETGITDLLLLELLGIEERLTYHKNAWKTTYYYLFVTHERDVRPIDPHHTETLWYPLDEMPDLFWPEQTRLVRQHAERIITRAQEFLTPGETFFGQ